MRRSALLLASVLMGLCLFTSVAQAKGPAYDDPRKTDADFAFQGEYVGMLPTENGENLRFGVQIIAEGKGEFQAVAYPGGLPGDGWTGSDVMRHKGVRKGDEVIFEADQGRGVLKDGALLAQDKEGNVVGKLEKIERKSPTLGQAPPEGAVILFNGQGADQWQNGQVTEDGLLQQGTTSNRTFGDHKLHIEFRLPYQPEDRGQARGNSGIYVQGRYEVQMLDSFGLEGKDNECGGLYSVKAPDVNMCLPPLTWQTYDIEYTAAKFDDSGKLVKNPRITVSHNGVKIHDNVELPGERSTTAAPSKPGPEPGPVYLQNHGNPVRYRNIWVVEE